MENLKTKHKYNKYLFKSNVRFMCLYGFILFLSLPLLVLFINSNNIFIYELGKFFNITISLIASILIPLKVYKFTTSKKALDVYDSLPMQKESLFLCHFINGLIQLLLPLTISWILGLGIYGLLSGNVSLLNNPSYIISIQNELFILFEVCIGLICCFSITTFVKQNCGTIIDTFIYTIVVHLLPIMTYLAFYLFCASNLLGFQEPFANDFIMYLSPIPNIYNIVTRGFVEINNIDLRFIYLLIISIILYYFSSKLYVNHKSEQAENPFSNKHFFPITSILCAITCMIFIHTLSSDLLSVHDFTLRYVYPILIGGSLYLILDVIASRGFRHIIKASLGIVLIGSIVLALLFPIQFTKGFGYVTSIPKLESVNSVSIAYYSHGSKRFNFSDYRATLTYDDPKDIETIINFHEFILNKYKAFNYNKQNFYTNYRGENDNIYYSTITLSYDVAIGTKNRTYTIDSAWLDELEALRSSDTNTLAIYPFLDPKSAYLIDKISISDSLKTNENLISKQLIDINKLKEYMLLDLQNETFDQKINNTYNYGYLIFLTTDTQKNSNNIIQSSFYFSKESLNQQSTFSFPLYAQYTNTLDYLKNQGVEFVNSDLSESSAYTLALIENEEFNLDDGYKNGYGDSKASLEENYLPYTNFPYKYKIIESDSDVFKQIIPYANDKYIENDNVKYFVLIDNAGEKYYLLNESMFESIEAITKDIPYLDSIQFK